MHYSIERTVFKEVTGRYVLYICTYQDAIKNYVRMSISGSRAFARWFQKNIFLTVLSIFQFIGGTVSTFIVPITIKGLQGFKKLLASF